MKMKRNDINKMKFIILLLVFLVQECYCFFHQYNTQPNP